MMKMKAGTSVKGPRWFGNGLKAANAQENASAEWEVRPCGMLVQKRDPDADAAHMGPVIRVKVTFGRASHRFSVNAHSTFGDLKKLLVQSTGMQTKQQRLLYKGKERCDRDYLYEFGVKDKSKIVLVEDTKGWEKRLIEMRKDDADAKACKTVSDVQQIVDQVSGQIVSMESDVLKGKKLSDDEIMGKIDFLMCQLVKLDDSKVDGDAKVQKQILVRRVQKYVETLDALKLKNDALKVRNGSTTIALDNISNVRVGPSSVRVNVATSRFAPAKSRSDMPSTPTSTVVTTTWETFGSSTGSASSKSTPPPASEPLLIQWD